MSPILAWLAINAVVTALLLGLGAAIVAFVVGLKLGHRGGYADGRRDAWKALRSPQDN